MDHGELVVTIKQFDSFSTWQLFPVTVQQNKNLDGRSHVKDNYQKARKTNDHFEKQILNHISNPHQDMFTQIE